MDLYVVRYAVAYKRAGDRWPDAWKRSSPSGVRGRFQARRRWGSAARAKGRDRTEQPLCSGVADSGASGAGRLANSRLLRGTGARLPAAQCPQRARTLGDVGSVAIIGHRPGLHELVSYLLTGDMIGEDCGACPDQKRRRGSPLLRGAPRAGCGLPPNGCSCPRRCGLRAAGAGLRPRKVRRPVVSARRFRARDTGRSSTSAG